MNTTPPPADLNLCVEQALSEDIGPGDVTSVLLPRGQIVTARVTTREAAVLCGQPWFAAAFQMIDPTVSVTWAVPEGSRVQPDDLLCTVTGCARAIFTGERTALNFLQTLSGTATSVRRYVDAVAGTGARIVDTRQTLPGLRSAQKYAVLVGGGLNHRLGLYDGFLIEDVHSAAAGGLREAIHYARAMGLSVPIMAEIRTREETRIALDEDIDLLLVESLPLELVKTVARMVHEHRDCGGRTLVEYSGGASLENVRSLAETGVDRVAVGSVTKHLRAVDITMKIVK
ncbi:carboxylating nicotinate-nucleotide diphosphorylase [Sphaerotilus montanus]|jgi:nicotinate-nucleotide pyrophosphorylase (carboxylating)|uniref:Probable nicotinate-nucleotide pyrophosphorylase [carboxylating] n=1 Tax=Sphaerotilus montanus TaxID=522889 RepID=A0A7Y9R0E0_9BURK|nr:carboxylating nicotinate-nucleotide diphosphorylase [Sphaerotilus montanus]NYG34866.1 nicotinate-nucleotide pyrophosphorylase (carboxylating) [Sphaerotilus montanus]NZD55538.1 carboxylating nicotinate-nucleotide diphosphorylase [Sphaerotilus montanus]